MAAMHPALGTPGGSTDASSSPTGVAGRIDAAETDLGRAISDWLAYLRARGKKPKTISAFRQVVERAARDCGWSRVADLTFDAVTRWLAGHTWKRVTYNRNLTVFRSLTRYLRRAKRIAEDPLEAAERAEDDGGDGARAATVEDARAVILQAWVRDRADRRCKGNRALYWLCLFAAGCRISEPGRWRRRHLVLEHQHPHVLWTEEISKNHKRQEVALGPELAGLLREHLRRVDEDRARAGLPAAGPDDLVFPVVPFKGTFVKDRDAAGIPAADYRGRTFSAHSARKFFSTTLTAAGVPEKMVDRLMRHSGRVEHRYYDPPLAEQAEAVARLPRLWPDHDGHGANRQPDKPPNVENSNLDLTSTARRAEDVAGTPVGPSGYSSSTERPGPVFQPPECQRSAVYAGLGRQVERLMRAAGQGRPEQAAGRLKPTAVCIPKSAFSVAYCDGIEANDLADLFEVLARLLRTRSSGHEGRSEPSPKHT